MSDLRRMAEELLTLGAVRDAVNAEYKRRHAALQDEYRQLGLERQRVTLPDGTDFGMAVLAAGSVSVLITDHDAMVDWLETKHPGELVTRTVYEIRPAYWKVLVEAAKAAGVGVDPETGERLDWIEVQVGDQTLRATPTADAKRMVRELITGTGLRLELTAE